MNLTVVVSVLIAVGIFMVLPYYLSSIIEKHTSSHLVMTVLEGVIRVAIFLIYIVLISRTKDIKRTFMYHGAEHTANGDREPYQAVLCMRQERARESRKWSLAQCVL